MCVCVCVCVCECVCADMYECKMVHAILFIHVPPHEFNFVAHLGFFFY